MVLESRMAPGRLRVVILDVILTLGKRGDPDPLGFDGLLAPASLAQRWRCGGGHVLPCFRCWRRAERHIRMAETERPRKAIAGRYEVLRPLGRGGMGKVFLVRDLTTGQELALKMLRSQWQSRKAVIARFLREIETVRQLDHPCIVKILDAHHDDELLFYTMEYVEGKSLRHWLQKRGKLEFGSVVRVLCLVAHALEHAHRVTIHRDLSPENIMVLPDGSVRLLDFGLAKIEDANQGLTMVGSSLGKMQYVAPEQRRNAAKVDHRADLYPLGIMFFEMLSGQLPNGRDLLSRLCPGLPPGTDAFVARAVAADPAERFQSAREFRHALLALYESSKAPRTAGQGRDGGAVAPAPPRRGLFARLRAWWRRPG